MNELTMINVNEANKRLFSLGLAVFPTCNGVMCIIDSKDVDCNCPPILDRINCSRMAGASTICNMVKDRIKRWK